MPKQEVVKTRWELQAEFEQKKHVNDDIEHKLDVAMKALDAFIEQHQDKELEAPENISDTKARIEAVRAELQTLEAAIERRKNPKKLKEYVSQLKDWFRGLLGKETKLGKKQAEAKFHTQLLNHFEAVLPLLRESSANGYRLEAMQNLAKLDKDKVTDLIKLLHDKKPIKERALGFFAKKAHIHRQESPLMELANTLEHFLNSPLEVNRYLIKSALIRHGEALNSSKEPFAETVRDVLNVAEEVYGGIKDNTITAHAKDDWGKLLEEAELPEGRYDDMQITIESEEPGEAPTLG